MKLNKMIPLLFIVLMLFAGCSQNVESVLLSEAGNRYLDDNISSIAISDTLIFAITDNEGYKVFNVSNPYDMKFCEVQCYPFSGYEGSIHLNGNFAYILTGSVNILDISNPLNPELVGHFYTGNYASDIDFRENYAFVSDDGGYFSVYDISHDISKPESLDRLSIGERIENFCIRGDFAYLVTRSKGLIVVDISLPEKLKVQTVYNTQQIENAENIELSDSFAYIACPYTDIAILNIESIDSIFLINKYQADLKTNIIGKGLIKVKNNILFYLTCKNLIICDISDPTAPIEVAYSVISAIPNGMQVEGNFLYVNCENSLKSFDCSEILK